MVKVSFFLPKKNVNIGIYYNSLFYNILVTKLECVKQLWTVNIACRKGTRQFNKPILNPIIDLYWSRKNELGTHTTNV